MRKTSGCVQGLLKQMEGIALNGPGIMQNGLKLLSQIFEKYFQMVKFIDRKGSRSQFLLQIVATPQIKTNKKYVFSLFYPLAMYQKKWPKMAMFMRTGK